MRPAADDAFFGGWAFVRYAMPRRNVLYLELVRDDVFRDDAASASEAVARATLEAALESADDTFVDLCVCARIIQVH